MKLNKYIIYAAVLTLLEEISNSGILFLFPIL